MTFLRWHELIIIREKSYFLDEKLEFNKPFFDDANDIAANKHQKRDRRHQPQNHLSVCIITPTTDNTVTATFPAHVVP